MPSPGENLHDAIQRWAVDDEDVELEDNVVTGWVVVAEVMSPDGRRGLAYVTGGPGDHKTSGPPPWSAVGMLRAAEATLNGAIE